MREEEAMVLIMTTFILAGAGLMMGTIVNRRKMREMEHRERLAMIERGLMPSPEADPMRFEAAAGFAPARESVADRTGATAVRYRTAGVLLIGLGLGLMLLITFTAGAPEIGIGVGGAWAILGAASLLNYFLMMRRGEVSGSGMPVRWAPPPARPAGTTVQHRAVAPTFTLSIDSLRSPMSGELQPSRYAGLGRQPLPFGAAV